MGQALCQTLIISLIIPQPPVVESRIVPTLQRKELGHRGVMPPALGHTTGCSRAGTCTQVCQNQGLFSPGTSSITVGCLSISHACGENSENHIWRGIEHMPGAHSERAGRVSYLRSPTSCTTGPFTQGDSLIAPVNGGAAGFAGNQ